MLRIMIWIEIISNINFAAVVYNKSLNLSYVSFHTLFQIIITNYNTKITYNRTYN